MIFFPSKRGCGYFGDKRLIIFWIEDTIREEKSRCGISISRHNIFTRKRFCDIGKAIYKSSFGIAGHGKVIDQTNFLLTLFSAMSISLALIIYVGGSYYLQTLRYDIIYQIQRHVKEFGL